VGYLSYEAARYFERLPLAGADPLDLPDAVFLDIDTLLIFDHVRHSVRIVSHAWPETDHNHAYRQAVERIERLAARLAAPLPAITLPEPVSVSPVSNLSQAEFEGRVAQAQEHIRAGDILQVVLSQRLSMPLAGDPFSFYRRLRALSPSPYLYYLDFVDHQLAGASPELLIQVEAGPSLAVPLPAPGGVAPPRRKMPPWQRICWPTTRNVPST
jgi:anthranilate synthase component 1